MSNTVLFPSSFFDRTRVDEDLEREHSAALSIGAFQIILFSYEDWFVNGRLRLTETPVTEISAVYRGWMMKPEQYTEFFNQLLAHNIRLITTPEMYSLMHVFPNIYPSLRADTAPILTFPLHSQINVDLVKGHFKRFLVKDYVKSVKGTEFPACFDDTITQSEFDRWMEVFYHYRSGLLTGGICVKEFLDLKHYGEQTNEYRVFYINHEIASICRNSLQRDYTPEPPRSLIEAYRNLDSVFYSIDYAELADGSWTIIEAGDGSVSGLSAGQDCASFYRALAQYLNQ